MTFVLVQPQYSKLGVFLPKRDENHPKKDKSHIYVGIYAEQMWHKLLYTQQWYSLISLETLTHKNKKKTTIMLSTSRDVHFSKMLSNCEVSI